MTHQRRYLYLCSIYLQPLGPLQLPVLRYQRRQIYSVVLPNMFRLCLVCLQCLLQYRLIFSCHFKVAWKASSMTRPKSPSYSNVLSISYFIFNSIEVLCALYLSSLKSTSCKCPLKHVYHNDQFWPHELPFMSTSTVYIFLSRCFFANTSSCCYFDIRRLRLRCLDA